MAGRFSPLSTEALIESAEARVQELSCIHPQTGYKIKGRYVTASEMITEMQGFIEELKSPHISENYKNVLRGRVKKYVFFQL